LPDPPEVNGPAGILALAWVAENPVDESGGMFKEKQLPGAEIRGIIDL
jgi:hypothetical protein